MQSAELFNVVAPADGLARVLRVVAAPLPAESVPVMTALGRVTAADLAAPADLPAFARSTMDGYAVAARDTFGASESLPALLEIVGEVAMGRTPDVRLGPGQAARIFTGGLLPDGADAVVIIEETQLVGPVSVEVLRPAAPGEHVVRPGEDVRRGEVVVLGGHVLRPQDLGALLGVGLTAVAVRRRPRVAIVPTGDEIVPPDVEPQPGQVRNINGGTLAAQVLAAGGVPLTYPIVPDDAEALRRAARAALDAADVLVLSAGSSVSTRDMTATVLDGLGSPGIVAHGVALKPGKPTVLAVADGKAVFGLPGNPVSSMITFELFVAPTLRHLLGIAEPPRPATVRAALARNVPSAPGREDHLPVRLVERDGALLAEPVFGKSNLIFTLVRADGLIVVPLDALGLMAGQSVDVRLF
ncbi:MAG: molybdopterin molybdenumtransferase MoeA [Chloroflexi bacterium]|nr:molybdopterin molybdenumtransferase MoeA [Chloroflexota bacterium]